MEQRQDEDVDIIIHVQLPQSFGKSLLIDYSKTSFKLMIDKNIITKCVIITDFNPFWFIFDINLFDLATDAYRAVSWDKGFYPYKNVCRHTTLQSINGFIVDRLITSNAKRQEK